MWIRAEANAVKGLANVTKPGLYPGVCWMKYLWGVQNRGSHERESVRILRRRKGREWASERRHDRWEGTTERTLGVCQGPMNGPSFEVSSSRPKGLWEVGTLVLRMWFSGGTSILKPRFWDPNFVTLSRILLISSVEQFFEFVKKHRFRFFKYFRIKILEFQLLQKPQRTANSLTGSST